MPESNAEPFSGHPYVPSAFPSAVGAEGMSLRDYFAAAAITGLARGYTTVTGMASYEKTAEQCGVSIRIAVATLAYNLADALLEVRTQGGTTDA